MPRLFVDVDDTLLLVAEAGDKDAHPYSIFYHEYVKLNEPLFEQMCSWSSDIIIWSGGGRRYAEYAAQWILGERFAEIADRTSFLGKDKDSFGLARAGDMVVDDQPIVVRTHTPHERFTD